LAQPVRRPQPGPSTDCAESCVAPAQEANLTHDVYLRYWPPGPYDPARGPVVALTCSCLTRSTASSPQFSGNRAGKKVQQWVEPACCPDLPRSAVKCAETDNLAERVRAALDTIPPPKPGARAAYLRGLSPSAIASQLQLPLGTANPCRARLIRLRTPVERFAAQP